MIETSRPARNEATPARWRANSHRAADQFPIEDWDRAPWNRWAFQLVRELVPTAEVWRGVGPVSPLAEARQDLSRIAFLRHDGSKSTVSGLLDSTSTDGFIVIHRGRILAEEYRNGMTPRTLHLSQSVAKSVVGSVAGVLVHQGLLVLQHVERGEHQAEPRRGEREHAAQKQNHSAIHMLLLWLSVR